MDPRFFTLHFLLSLWPKNTKHPWCKHYDFPFETSGGVDRHGRMERTELWFHDETEGVSPLSVWTCGRRSALFPFWTPVTISSWSGPWLIESVCKGERERKGQAIARDGLIDLILRWRLLLLLHAWFWRLADVHAIEPEAESCQGQRKGEESRLHAGLSRPAVHQKLSESPFFLSLPHCPSEKWNAGGAGWCSESVPGATGVLTGVVRGVLLGGCGLASPSVKVFSWDWEEEEEEWVLSLELLRVSVLVLVFFIFLLLASGALSTVCRRKPSRLHLLNAWDKKRRNDEPVIKISMNYSFF